MAGWANPERVRVRKARPPRRTTFPVVADERQFFINMETRLLEAHTGTSTHGKRPGA
jgi:hypothetical protein